MAHVRTHSPGSFCWLELYANDQNAAKQFYQSLFGWASDDMPMGPGEVYTLFSLEGRNAAAATGLNERMRAQGVPPHWMLYISVESADAAAAKAQQAGGKLMAPPFDVADFGRMAVVQDPTGAHFSIWQPKGHPGTGITGAPGTLCWADLMTPDPTAAAKFYVAVMGWKLEPKPDHFSGYLPPTTMEKVGRVAMVDDPQGAGFALFEPPAH
ncbi:MAG TPA: VOC family protein [Bryobacteraceae bacterium]|nr:VOC family protein [Bryobacteraceae bacterium]